MTGGVKRSFYYSSKYTEKPEYRIYFLRNLKTQFFAMTLEIKALLTFIKRKDSKPQINLGRHFC